MNKKRGLLHTSRNNSRGSGEQRRTDHADAGRGRDPQMRVRAALVVLAGTVGGMVAAGCLFSAWLGSESWGGPTAPLATGAAVGLVGAATVALALPLVLWRWLLPETLRRSSLLLGLTGLTVCMLIAALLLGLGA
jgi:hypothetical protein